MDAVLNAECIDVQTESHEEYEDADFDEVMSWIKSHSASQPAH